jgi:hypothetical protein
MSRFEDLLGGQKMYTEDEIREAFLDSFMVGVDLFMEKLDLEKDDVVTLEKWYSEKYVDKVIELCRSKLTDEEFNLYIQWQKTDLAKKSVRIQADVSEMIGGELQLIIGAILSK